VLSQRGPFRHTRRWWRGVHPGKGIVTKGWTGWETVEETNKIIPIHTFGVKVSRLSRIWKIAPFGLV
jgi:hypothetical protein